VIQGVIECKELEKYSHKFMAWQWNYKT
jgi:hypothetical protein